MAHRRSTIWLPILALVVATVLLSHDLVMAADPHDPAAHAAHDHHVTSHAQAPSSDTAPDDHASACGTFEAVRATDRDDLDGDLMLGGRTDFFQFVDLSDFVQSAPVEPGASPAQIRAMLQVFLN